MPLNKVSVLMPVYNTAAYLTSTLQSVVNSIQKHDEIIIIDDASSDNSVAVAQNFLDKNHQNYTLQANSGSGACAARNQAFAIAEGTWIQWIDADDLISVNKIPIALQILNKNHKQLVACPWHPFKLDLESGMLPDDVDWTQIPFFSTPEQWIARDTFMGLHCYAGHRELFEQAGPWDESLTINQDGEYFARVVAKSEGVNFTQETDVFYRRSSSGSVSRFSPEKADSLYRSTESMVRTAFGLESSERMRQMAANRWQHFIYTVYPSRSDLIAKAEGHLRHLPKPNISNPNAVSPVSKFISKAMGWKVLSQARIMRNRMKS